MSSGRTLAEDPMFSHVCGAFVYVHGFDYGNFGASFD